MRWLNFDETRMSASGRTLSSASDSERPEATTARNDISVDHSVAAAFDGNRAKCSSQHNDLFPRQKHLPAVRNKSVRRVWPDNEVLGSRMTLRPFLIAVSSSIAVAIAAGCERPGDRTPDGFVDQCYGGRHQMARNWVCSDDRLVVIVEGGEADWPVLSRIILDYGLSHGLRSFDTSTNIPNYIRTLGLSVCSSEGLFINVDKRIYSDPSMNQDGNRITANFRTYRNSFDWKQLAEDFEGAFRKNWRGPVQVAWPEAVPARQKTGLPDSVKSCEETPG